MRFTLNYLFWGAKPYIWIGKGKKALLRSMKTPRPAQTSAGEARA
jgi:hypothetical protein